MDIAKILNYAIGDVHILFRGRAHMRNNVAIQLAIDTYERVREICLPIFKLFGLTFFRYLRVFPDGTRVHLCSNPEWTDTFYKNQFYNVAWYDSTKLVAPRSIETLWDEKSQLNDNAVGIEARTHFAMYHGISIVRSRNGYYEIFDFATDQENVQINDIYLNNLNFFDRFFFYFRDQARLLIKDAIRNPIKIDSLMQSWNSQNCYFLQQKKMDQFLKETQIKHYILSVLGEDVSLTPREAECIYWGSLGKSAEETSVIVGSSKRTVEIHLDNVKQKLGLSKISQVIKLASDSGVIETFRLNLKD